MKNSIYLVYDPQNRVYFPKSIEDQKFLYASRWNGTYYFTLVDRRIDFVSTVTELDVFLSQYGFTKIYLEERSDNPKEFNPKRGA